MLQGQFLGDTGSAGATCFSKGCEQHAASFSKRHFIATLLCLTKCKVLLLFPYVQCSVGLMRLPVDVLKTFPRHCAFVCVCKLKCTNWGNVYVHFTHSCFVNM